MAAAYFLVKREERSAEPSNKQSTACSNQSGPTTAMFTKLNYSMLFNAFKIELFNSNPSIMLFTINEREFEIIITIHQ